MPKELILLINSNMLQHHAEVCSNYCSQDGETSYDQSP